MSIEFAYEDSIIITKTTLYFILLTKKHARHIVYVPIKSSLFLPFLHNHRSSLQRLLDNHTFIEI